MTSNTKNPVENRNDYGKKNLYDYLKNLDKNLDKNGKITVFFIRTKAVLTFCTVQ